MGADTRHFYPAEAAASSGADWLVQSLQSMIDAGFKMATGQVSVESSVSPKQGPRPWSSLIPYCCISEALLTLTVSDRVSGSSLPHSKLTAVVPSAITLSWVLHPSMHLLMLNGTLQVEALRPLGVQLLKAVLAKFGDAKDPLLPEHLLLEQFQAQYISALR